MQRMLASLHKIINLQTLIVTFFAVVSTHLCNALGWIAEFPLTLIGIAVVFPIVFSISGAYKRRESALDEYGSIKAHGRAIYFASRDWISAPDKQEEAKKVLAGLLDACRTLFQMPLDEMHEQERAVYAGFSRLSKFVNSMRESGLASGEASRCNQYLSKMVIAFENIKHIYQYRTPRTLRAYSQFFIYTLPVLYGPYFAWLSREFSPGLGFVMPVLFSVVLVSLENIQEHLEDPFDQVGEDDVIINVEKFIARLEA